MDRNSASEYRALGRFPLVLVLSALAVCLDGCSRSDNAPPPRPPLQVSVMKVAPADVAVDAVYIAQTQSSQAVNIQARVSGFLDKRVYVEGSAVKAGDVLFRMDPKPFQAQVDDAKAALQLQQAAMETAKANLARVKPLTEQEALSQKDLDNAQGQYQQSAAAVEQAKAQLRTAQLNLSYTTITSPLSGVTSFSVVPEGTFVGSANSQLTTVSALTPMWVNFSLSESQLESIHRQVEKGLLILPPNRSFDVELELVDGTMFPHKGRITFADPSYNSQTGTFLIRASVDNPDGVLRPNQYVRAHLIGARRPNAILVPQRAVQQGAKGHFVWVIGADKKAEARPVEVGDWHGDDWFINEGLAAGDEIAVDGTLRVAPGATVIVTPYVPTPARNAAPAAIAPPAAAGQPGNTGTAPSAPPAPTNK